MMTKNRSIAILLLSFVVVTGYLIRDNWNFGRSLKVTEVLTGETSVPAVGTENSQTASTPEDIHKATTETTIVDPVFEAFLDEISERLPTKNQYRYLSAAEAHGQPRILLETASDFGHLAERLEQNVSLRPKGLEFYKGCALNNDLVTTVRAVCFYHAQVLEIDLHARIWETDAVPNQVVELAKTL